MFGDIKEGNGDPALVMVGEKVTPNYRAGLSYRSYGEYDKRVSTGDGGSKMEGRVPGLVGHVCPDYGIPKIKGKRATRTTSKCS